MDTVMNWRNLIWLEAGGYEERSLAERWTQAAVWQNLHSGGGATRSQRDAEAARQRHQVSSILLEDLFLVWCSGAAKSPRRAVWQSRNPAACLLRAAGCAECIVRVCAAWLVQAFGSHRRDPACTRIHESNVVHLEAAVRQSPITREFLAEGCQRVRCHVLTTASLTPLVSSALCWAPLIPLHSPNEPRSQATM